MDGDYILLGYTTNKFYDLQGCVIVYILYSVVLPLRDGSHGDNCLLKKSDTPKNHITGEPGVGR